MSASLEVVILAAGKGRRMNSTVPKPLQKIGQEAMLAHVIRACRGLEALRISVVYAPENLALFQSEIQAPDICWVPQKEALGTAHAVWQVVRHMGWKAKTVLVLCADTPLIQTKTLFSLLHQKALDAIGLLVTQVPDPSGFGRVILEGDEICAIVEEKELKPEQHSIACVSSGIWAFPASILAACQHEFSLHPSGEYYLSDIVALARAKGVQTQMVSAVWTEVLGVNTPFQLYQAERCYQQIRAKALLDAGVRLRSLDQIEIRGELVCASGVEIDVGVIFEGKVVIEKGAKIGPYCVLKDCYIGPGVCIEGFSALEGADIRENGKIGPYARIRPGTVLGSHVKIGNFVEVKKSEIGSYSKISHLSYVGDTKVGDKVNLGACVVTCNFDGKQKHQTMIEDGAFIGSGSQLVAPISVGEGAILGAGTTLLKNAPAHILTVTRKEQVSYLEPLVPKKEK